LLVSFSSRSGHELLELADSCMRIEHHLLLIAEVASNDAQREYKSLFVQKDANAITWRRCGAAGPVPICPPPPVEVQAGVAAMKVVQFCRMALPRKDNRSDDPTRIRTHSARLFCRRSRDSRPSGISTISRTIPSHSRAVWGPAGVFRGSNCPPRGDGWVDRESGDCRFSLPPGGTGLVRIARVSKNSTAPPTIRTDPGLLRRRTPRAEAMKQAGAILH
jgi:hypothetical protein